AELRRVLRRDLAVVTTGVLRDNLFLAVQRVANDEGKLRALAELCARERGPGIVYVSSRERAEELARFLRRKGVRAQPYHAGLAQEARARVQDDFMRDAVRVVTATVAFGLGVDKPNVRFIVHYGLPRSLEAYAQESGRAGRDSAPARCVVLYSAVDKANLSRWQREDALTLDDLRRVYRAVREQVGAPPAWGWLDPEPLLAELNEGEPRPLSAVDLRVALSALERAGLLERGFDTPRGGTVELAAEGAGQERADGARAASRVSLARTETLTPFLDGADPSIAPPAPDALEWKLLEAEGAGRLRWRPGPRAPLVRLLPPPADAAERMQTLLRRAGRDDELELRRVVEYVEGQGCRLRAL